MDGFADDIRPFVGLTRRAFLSLIWDLVWIVLPKEKKILTYDLYKSTLTCMDERVGGWDLGGMLRSLRIRYTGLV